MPTGLFGFGQKEKGVEEALLFEGNDLQNIDPYTALPDPNVSVHRIQDGEFFGWVEKTNIMNLLTSEQTDADFFNVKYVEGMHNKVTSIYGEEKSNRERKWKGGQSNRYHTMPGQGTSISGGGLATRPTDVIHMYVKIIPKEWELSESEYPEKWLFSIAADSVVIRAKTLDLDHNRFPVAAAAPDFDGYSAIPVSRLEMLSGLQNTVNWMFNTHIANVRKSINDVLIYDPFMINSKDINSSEAGKRIRTRRPAWGRGVKDLVMQLDVQDVTRQHVADIGFMTSFMDKSGAVDDTSMGMLRQGGPERLSAAEFKGTQMGQLSRLGRIARVIGLQGMQDIGEMFAANTQQLMSQEQFVKVTGRWQDVLVKEYGVKKLSKDRGRMKVSPFDILVNYDLMVRDGSVPGGNFSEVWMKMFDIIAKQPELHQEFDLVRIFHHIARNNGAKNAQDFTRTQVMPDEQIAEQSQAGNIIPFNQSAIGGGF